MREGGRRAASGRAGRRFAGVLAAALAICAVKLLVVPGSGPAVADDGLPPPPLPKPPRPDPLPALFDPADPLAGLSVPNLVWPDPPAPLPGLLHLSFCDGFERADFSGRLLDWSKRVQAVWELARAYDSAVGLRLQQVANTMARIRQTPALADQAASYERALADLRTAKAASEGLLAEASEDLRTRSAIAETARLDVIDCLPGCAIAITPDYSTPLQMPPGIIVSQVDSRGTAHLPPRQFDHVGGNPGDQAYHLYRVTMRPAVGHCMRLDDGLHLAFSLYGGAGVENEYFSVERIAGAEPTGLVLYQYGGHLFEKLRVTFDNGQVAETVDNGAGVLVPPGARRVTRIEFVMNGQTVVYP